MKERTLVSFDWAIKKLLRQKVNFVILEGFLSELLGTDIIIEQMLESESNKLSDDDKHSRVDMLCINQQKELILIELQFYKEIDYFQRMLYTASKVLTEHISEGESYFNVKKLYSINILYFDLGQGDDYIYEGKMQFSGKNLNDTLSLSHSQQKTFDRKLPGELFPEFYLIKVNKFNDISKNTLDEWIYFLKNTALPNEYKAKGLEKVNHILNYNDMDATVKSDYDVYLKNVRISESAMRTAVLEAKEEGKIEGKIEGEIKGEIKGKIEIILNAFENGISKELIANISNMSLEEIESILKKHGKI